MKNIRRIKGERICLCVRRMDEEAQQLYMEWINDPETASFLGKTTETLHYIDESEHCKRVIKGEPKFNIVSTTEDKIVGNCDLYRKGFTRNYTLGIVLAPEARDKGYGSEAVQLLVDYAFKSLNAHRVMLRLISSNARAKRVYEKAGFKVCGTEHETDWIDGAWYDTVSMEILEQDYFNNINQTNPN